jgi:hypothetical protein
MIFQCHIAKLKPSAAVYGRAGGVSLSTTSSLDVHWDPFHHHQQQLFLNVGLSGIQSVRSRNEQKFRCRNQFGSEIRGPSPVPEDTGCRNADAGGIDLNADELLC